MSKVIDEFRISKYAVLKLDIMPEKQYQKFRIEGNEFDPVPVYDLPQCISIESQQSFLGKTVEFI